MFDAVRVITIVFVLGALASGVARADERRVALVIGNADYKATAALRNTVHDADIMSSALKDVGFEVVDGRNLDKAGADRALARFASLMQGADVTLFYFAGHGLQISGQNYLLPVDARSEDELSLPFESVKLNDVLSLLGQNGGVRIVVLDACRNNPFSTMLAQKQGSRSVGVSRGLARAEKSQGMLVAYATQANEVAEDGNSGNSPFTQELVRAIREPGVKVGDVFQNVVRKVHESTGGRQTPEVSFSLVGEFYFNRSETDLDAWKTAAASKDVRQLKAFMARFPASPWVDTAHTLIEALETNEAREKVAEQLRAQNRKLEALQARLDQAQESERSKAEEWAARNRAESEREHNRLASELEGKRRQTAAIESEKAQLEKERARLEQALAGRLAITNAPVATPAAAAPQRPPEKQADAAPPPPAATARSKPVERTCSEILTRIQLGEMTAADVEALKRCR